MNAPSINPAGDPFPAVAHLVLSNAQGGLEQCAGLWRDARNHRAPGSTHLVTLEPAPAGSAVIPAQPDACLHADRRRFPWDRRALARLRDVVRLHDIRIVHSHNTAARQVAGWIRRGLPIAHVYTEHGSNPHLHGLANRLRLAYLRRRTDIWAAVSETAAEKMATAERLPLERIHVVPNGVPILPPPFPDTAARAAFRRGWPISAPRVIGVVGRLAPEKGVDRLIRALGGMRRDSALVVIGDGPLRQALTALAADTGVSGRVWFAGAQPDARKWMAAVDLMVLPSRSEGLPLALLEAMAEGCPVAAADVGECARVLDHGRAGALLPADERQWAGVLDSLLAAVGTPAMDALIRRAADRVRTHYGLDRTLEIYEALYRSALEPTGGLRS